MISVDWSQYSNRCLPIQYRCLPIQYRYLIAWYRQIKINIKSCWNSNFKKILGKGRKKKSIVRNWLKVLKGGEYKRLKIVNRNGLQSLVWSSWRRETKSDGVFYTHLLKRMCQIFLSPFVIYLFIYFFMQSIKKNFFILNVE